MDMYQKRKIRAEKKNNNQEEKLTKVGINWFPGHMVKAQNEIKNNLKLIDVVVEILDARVPIASHNKLMDELAKDKKRIVVLNKSDLADKVELTKWEDYYKNRGDVCVLTNANKSENISKLVNEIRKQGKGIYEKKYSSKNIKVKPIYRCLIAGIPNVGKSTIINKIANRNAAATSNKPGVTRKNQWIRVGSDIELLDTPGILMPRLDENNAGVKLALTGNVKLEVVDNEELACSGINLLINEGYKKLLVDSYSIEEELLDELDSYDILEVIGRKRGCLVSGGNVDMSRAANVLLDEIKNGKIGNIVLEKVEM